MVATYPATTQDRARGAGRATRGGSVMADERGGGRLRRLFGRRARPGDGDAPGSAEAAPAVRPVIPPPSAPAAPVKGTPVAPAKRAPAKAGAPSARKGPA